MDASEKEIARLKTELENSRAELEKVRSSLEKKVKERTTQLEVAKKEWETTFDTINEPLVLLNPDYEILRANLSFARTVSKDIRDVLKNKCYKLLMGRDKPCEECPLANTFASQESGVLELRHKDAAPIYQLRSFLMSLEPPQVVHAYRDVTEETYMRQKLMQSEKLNSLGLLAGRVAHEINNPLAGILANVQLLLMDFSSEDETHDSLKDIEIAAQRCRKIVRDLLDFSRQNPTERQESHDITVLMHQVVDWYEMLPPTRNIDLQLDLAESLPRSRMDPAKIQSVFLNLLGNAKAAEPAPQHIWIQTYLEDNFIVVKIRDDGGGIPEAILEKVFDPFFTTKPTGLGTGLGLYIVREIITEHEGELSLESKEGEGTEFVVKLPIQ